MSTNAVGTGGSAGPGSRHRRRLVVVVVVVLVAAAVATWVVLARSGAVYDDLAAVPGVAEATDAQDLSVVLLDPDLDVNGVEDAVEGVVAVLAGSDLAQVTVGVEGGPTDAGVPRARVTVVPGDLRQGAALAPVLAVLGGLPADGLLEARGSAGSPALVVRADTDLVTTSLGVAAAAERAGVGDAVASALVMAPGEDQETLELSVSCDGGLAATRAAVEDLGRAGEVVAGAVSCGRPTSATIEVASADEASGARRTALRALGPEASVAVRAGGRLVLDGDGEPA